jgi:hypothetical protein
MTHSKRLLRTSVAGLVWFFVMLAMVVVLIGPMHDLYVAIEASVQARVVLTMGLAMGLATFAAVVAWRLLSRRLDPAPRIAASHGGGRFEIISEPAPLLQD